MSQRSTVSASDPYELLAQLRSLGFELFADCDDIVIEPGSRLTAEQRDALRHNKPDVLAILRTEQSLAIRERNTPPISPSSSSASDRDRLISDANFGRADAWRPNSKAWAGSCDNLHHMPEFWAAGVNHDRPGWSRIICRLCGRFIGYHPGDIWPSSN
jgi:hypothetical protein